LIDVDVKVAAYDDWTSLERQQLWNRRWRGC